MRRFVALLIACALAVLLLNPISAQASSATVVFSGPEEVQAGQTYTYTYRIEVKDVAAARIVPITAGGGFELVSGGEGLLYDTIPDNTSGSSSEGTIVVKVKSSARPGDKCTLSTSGDYAAIVIEDGQYGTSPDYGFSGSFVAVVTAGPAEEADVTPSPTSSPTAAPSPSATSVPTFSPAATPSLTPGASPNAETSAVADVTAQGSATTVTDPEPSGGQTPPVPIVSIMPETVATAPVDADKPGGIFGVLIVAGIAVLAAVAAAAIVYFVRRRRSGEPSPGRDATTISEDETASRMARRNKKRRH